jgi:hypothetical protein
MPEEIFDVVNERDEVIGRQSRRELHRLGLKHRAVPGFMDMGPALHDPEADVSPKNSTAANLFAGQICQ